MMIMARTKTYVGGVVYQADYKPCALNSLLEACAMKTKRFISVLFVLSIMVGVLTGCNSKEKSYSNAENLFNSGQYRDAAVEFEALGDYKDSQYYADIANKTITFNEWFGDVIWTGEQFIITVKKELQPVDASIFAGENEFKVHKSVIDTGGGSASMSPMHTKIIYGEGATINWFVDTDGAEPDRIIIELADGTILERVL